MTDLVYGPHDPYAAATATVTIRGRGRYAEEREVPVPAGILHQWRRMNEIAAGTPRRIVDRREP